ncbi:MAG TPA: hypothetical protein VGM54_06475 [Chthoniobacter sp.]|jgi:hypothetical protein
MDGEPFYIDEAGNRRDEALHAELLESLAGRLASDRAAVRQACAAGLPLAKALEYYASADLRAILASEIAGGK